MSANRGKLAEGKAKAFLKAESEKTQLVYYRLPDAHAGSMTATLADFLVAIAGRVTLLEVKQVEHAYRLPYLNFKVENASRMEMWQNAGVEGVVAVYHTPIKKWRIAQLARFLDRPLVSASGAPVGSWDLRDIEPVDNLRTLKSYF